MGHAWVLASLVSQRLSLLFSLPLVVPLSFFSRLQLRTSISDATSKLYTQRRKGSPTPDSDSRKLCLYAVVQSHRRTSFFLFLPFWNPWVSSSLVYVLPDSFPSFYRSLLSLGISFRRIGRKRTFPICSVNKSPQGKRSASHFNNKKLYVHIIKSSYSVFCHDSNYYCYHFSEFLIFLRQIMCI